MKILKSLAFIAMLFGPNILVAMASKNEKELIGVVNRTGAPISIMIGQLPEVLALNESIKPNTAKILHMPFKENYRYLINKSNQIATATLDFKKPKFNKFIIEVYPYVDSNGKVYPETIRVQEIKVE